MIANKREEHEQAGRPWEFDERALAAEGRRGSARTEPNRTEPARPGPGAIATRTVLPIPDGEDTCGATRRREVVGPRRAAARTSEAPRSPARSRRSPARRGIGPCADTRAPRARGGPAKQDESTPWADTGGTGGAGWTGTTAVAAGGGAPVPLPGVLTAPGRARRRAGTDGRNA